MSDTPSSGFGKFVPGFEFLQNLAGQAAGGVVQGIGQNIPQMPNLGHWVAPTFNVEDLEKRIEELKAVHFWLDQNSKALGATIQALEVQKMTLSTLKSMNFSMGDVANALKIKAADTLAGFTGAASSTPAPTAPTSQFAGLEIPARTYGNTPVPEPEPEPDEEVEPDEEMPEEAAPPVRGRTSRKAGAAAPAASGGVVDPMQWWGAISQQFQQIASNAMKDVARQTALDTTRQVATGLTDQAMKTATGMAGKAARSIGGSVVRNVGTAAGMGRAAARAVTAPRQKAAPKPAAKKVAPRAADARSSARASAAQPMAAGDWTLPTAFFPGFAALQPGSQPRAGASVTSKSSGGPSGAKRAGGAKAAVKKASVKKPALKKSSPIKPAARKSVAASTRKR